MRKDTLQRIEHRRRLPGQQGRRHFEYREQQLGTVLDMSVAVADVTCISKELHRGFSDIPFVEL